jgi:ABC-type multidrug transport system fused ATPase/permease subunit
MKPPNDRQLLWRAFLYLRPYWQSAAAVYAAMLVINGVNILIPQFIRHGIDAGIYGRDLTQITLAAGGLLAATLFKGVFVYYQGHGSEIISQNVAYDLRNQLLRKLSHLSLAFHDRTTAGEILTRAMQDVERIRFLTGRAALRLIEGAVLAVMTAVILLWMNVTLAGLILLILPIVVYRMYHYGRRFLPLSLEIQNQLGVLTTRLEQNLRGARIVKAFAQETAEIERFDAENQKWFDLSAHAARIQAINGPLLDGIANLGVVFILGVGGWLVAQNELTLGELVAFITYLSMLIRPVNMMGRMIPMLAVAASAGRRIFAILDEPVLVDDAADALELPRLRGHVRFEAVSFVYPDGNPALQNITFEAQPGQVIALMGATGSGKTTLTNLIARFYDPSDGRITIDGLDIRRARRQSLRNQIGFVMQDTILFAASIRENISFGRPDASAAELIQAAKDAQAHDFIMNLPDGYDARVGERGVTLSGGQKQRLAIARALLTDPRILILDDATASVDSQTERLIQQALNRLMAGRTTFVIAHRLSTVQRADLILLLDQGRIAAAGAHDDLLAQSPLYQEIYALQTRS